MIKESLLSAADIARELDTGIATVKFLLKRFKNHLPGRRLDGRHLYSKEAVKILIQIQEKIDMGILPSDIEQELKHPEAAGADLADTISSSFEAPLENGDIRMSSDGLTLLKSLFSDIGEQQKRIATAHEKRAQAEERKAVAIEKRASAEEKKAEAMNNIAAALQEMNKLRSSDPAAQQIAHQAAKAISTEEMLPEEWESLENLDDLDDMNDLEQTQDTSPAQEKDEETDDIDEMNADLSSLLEEDNLIEEVTRDEVLVDDIDMDFDEALDDALSDPLADLEDISEPDDLSALVEDFEETKAEEVIKEISLDDLSLLVDDASLKEEITDDAAVPLDDLSLLIEQPLDDLSSLIDHEGNTPAGEQDIDDLSLLIDAPENGEAQAAPGGDMDDLSLLIDDGSDGDQADSIPEIKLDVTPEDGIEEYKSAVMKVIIGLKTEGFTAEEATVRLNRNHIQTLSGKPEWSLKAISQIYKFINSAK